jgi:hypothetical protein
MLMSGGQNSGRGGPPLPHPHKKKIFTQKPPRWAHQGILKGNRQWESTSGVQQTPRGHQNFQFYHGFPSSSTVRTSRFRKLFTYRFTSSIEKLSQHSVAAAFSSGSVSGACSAIL